MVPPLLLPVSRREILMGKSLRLKHGWVAVVNRGQADINKRMTMNEARAKEIEFFRGTDAYRCVVCAVCSCTATVPD